MKNFVQEGEQIRLTAPYAVSGGQGVLVGTQFGVAVHDAAISTPVEMRTNGVFDMLKVGSQAWTVGAAIYWDNAARNTTTVVASNTAIGTAMLAVGSGAGETTGRVRLRGV